MLRDHNSFLAAVHLPPHPRSLPSGAREQEKLDRPEETSDIRSSWDTTLFQEVPRIFSHYTSLAFTGYSVSGHEPFSSWNNTATKDAIFDFVGKVTTLGKDVGVRIKLAALYTVLP
jgi:L-ribulose-5-phosphate 3-epimerase UlaE